MYKLQRAPRIREEIELGDEVITIDIDVENSALEFNKRYNEIIAAERAMHEASNDENADKLTAMKAYGDSVILLFELIFGKENTEKILTFYERKYLEMSLEVFPFIINVVKPKLDKAIKDLREKAAEQYKQAQRRKFRL